MVAELPDSYALEGKTEKVEVSRLEDPRLGSEGKLKPLVPNDISLIWDVPLKVVGNTAVGRDPGFSVEFSVLFIGMPLPVIAEPEL